MPIGTATPGNACYAPSALLYTPTLASGSADAAFPLTRIADLKHPARAFRTTNTTPPVIDIDFGAATTVAAWSIENINCGQVRLLGNATATWGSPAFDQTFATDTADDDDMRRKRFCVPAVPFAYRYLRVMPLSLDAGASYVEFGSLGIWPEVVELTTNLATPYAKKLERTKQAIDLVGGTRDIGRVSATRVRIIAQAALEWGDASSLEEFREIANIPESRVWLFFENRGDLTKMYHVQTDGIVEVSYGNDATITVQGLELIEMGL